MTHSRTPRRPFTRAWLGALAVLGVATAGCAPMAQAQPSHTVVEGKPLQTEPVVGGLEHPWSLAFLPDGRLLVTERPGRLRIATLQGELSDPIQGLPEVAAAGQGGLLDVVLDPAHASNQLVYWSFSEPGPGGSSTAVARGRLDVQALRLHDVQVIFSQIPKVNARQHFGSRLVFGRDGHLFITMGDRGSHRDESQSLASHIGTVVRIHPDGGVPQDNPFVERKSALPEIWSYGHRNVQGATLHPSTGRLWTHEHGPQGGDEINVARAGLNYGWPVITYGREYGSGRAIGEGTTGAGMEQPMAVWTPSIAPSGMAFYTGDRHPQWQGQLFVGALRAQLLVRMELDGEKVVRETRHPANARIRDVRQGPDGHLYLVTDASNGQVVRVQP